MGCVIASDIGSSGCKSVVVDASGRLLAEASHDYPTRTLPDGGVEQDPSDWLDAVGMTVKRALAAARVEPAEVAAFGVVGVTHNAVLLDAHDRPLRPCILLFDTRSVAQSDAIAARWGSTVFERTCNGPSPAWTWPQLLWVREHEPEVWAATRRVLFQKDWVRHVLAPSPITDEIDAAGSLLFDPRRGRWIDEFVDDLGLPPDALPAVHAPTDVVARLSAEGAARTGLQAGTPVIAGTTDTAAETLGAGALEPGQGTVKLASVGRIAWIDTTPVPDARAFNYRFVLDGLWYPGTAIKYGSTALRWLRDACGGDADYDALDTAAATAGPGAGGLLFLPHLNGQWAPHWDASLRGAFVGLTAAHGRGHLARAVMEGVAFALRDAIDEARARGLRLHELRLLGGGSRSATWTQALADVLDCTLSVPEQRSAAWGAALLTGIGAGFWPARADAIAPHVRIVQRCEPDPARREHTRALHALYRRADAALAPIGRALGELQPATHGAG